MNPSTPQSDSIDIADYFSGLRRYRSFIIVVTLVSAATAAAIAFVVSRSYTASLTLAVIQSKYGADQIPIPPSASFRPLIESRTTAAAVIHELGLDKAPYNLAASSFLSGVISIEEVRATNLIKVTASFSDPQRAAAIAQKVGEHAVALSRKVNVDEGARAQKFISEQVVLAKARLEKAEKDYSSYQEQAQVEALKKDVESTLLERGTVLNLQVKIEAQKAKKARLEEELAKRKRVDVLTKTIDSEPALAEASRARADGRGVLGLQLTSESVSEAFDKLDGELASTSAELAGLEKQKAQLMAVHKVNAPALSLLSAMYIRESRLAHLKTERDLAEKIYLDVAARSEAARLQVGGRSAQLEIIDPAVVPDAPDSRHLLRDTIFGALVGLTASTLIAMVLQALRAAGGPETGRPAATA